MAKKLNVVIITGMSGAGKTIAVQAFEDLGYFVIDNMLPTLAGKFIDVIKDSGEFDKVAMVMDSRSKGFYDLIQPTLADLKKRSDLSLKVLFLDANDVTLVSRYKETRRAHPLAPHGRLMEGIDSERELLAELKSTASIVIDTTGLTPRNLRLRIADYFGNGHSNFYIEVMSFGFKYGLPLDADIVLDVRFLPNPYWVPSLRKMNGNDKAVQDYVNDSKETEEFYEHLIGLLNVSLPGYIKEGKSSLTIAIGCTGGQHRSVTIANRLAKDLEKNYTVSLHHRDVNKAR